MLMLKDVFFMLLVYFKFGEIYWDKSIYYNVLKVALPFYVPAIILDFLYSFVKKKPKGKRDNINEK